MSETSSFDLKFESVSPIDAPKSSEPIGAMLKITQVAERLNCSVSTVYQLVESKRLPHYRCPGIRISEEQLTEYLESCQEEVAPQRIVRRQPLRLKHIRL